MASKARINALALDAIAEELSGAGTPARGVDLESLQADRLYRIADVIRRTGRVIERGVGEAHDPIDERNQPPPVQRIDSHASRRVRLDLHAQLAECQVDQDTLLDDLQATALALVGPEVGAVKPSSEDYRVECERLHGGACGTGHAHRMRLRDDEEAE